MEATHAVIVNPVAGNGRTARSWPKIVAALREQGLTFDTSLTTGPGAATKLASEALRAGYKTIVAVGGDGTVNEVINGLLLQGSIADSDVRLGIVSCGTGCDLVRSLGLSRGADSIPALSADHSISIDVGRVTFRSHDGQQAIRYFANVADLGLGGEAAELVNQNSKMLGGFLSFLCGAVVSIIRYRNKALEYSLDGAPAISSDVGMIIVANGQYFAGGMYVAPGAELDDGLFDVIVLEATSKVDLVFNLLPRVYRGAHLNHGRVRYCRARTVTVRSEERVLLEMDGEQPGLADAEFTVVSKALRVAVPASLAVKRARDARSLLAVQTLGPRQQR